MYGDTNRLFQIFQVFFLSSEKICPIVRVIKFDFKR